MRAVIIGVLLSPFLLIAQQTSAAWTNIGPTPAAVEAIAVDPQGSGTIFIGSIAGGVRKSADGGITWSTVNTGLTNLDVLALAMDASGPQTVYAATAGSLFKTDDGGATWQNLTAISGAVASVAADPSRSGVVYAGVYNNLANGSIRKSIDGGVTWATVFPTTAAIFNITIDPGNSDVLYAPTVGHGAFKSTDGGQHWSPMPALTPAAIWTLALDPANSQILYAGTNQDGIWKSADAGNTWQQVGSPGAFPVCSLTVDPSAAHTIYAGANGGGVWTSSDGGVTWESTGLSNGMVWSLAVDSAGALYAGTNAAGAQVSRDRGATWTILHAGIDAVNKFGYGIWIDSSNGQKMFVSSEVGYGMLWSEDGGASWSIAGQGFTGYGSRGVAFDPSDSQRIYAGAMIGTALFKSTDGGLTWSPRRFGSPAVYVIAVAVDPLSPNVVYAGTQNEGLFKSADYGDTWASVGSGLSGAITYLTLDPTTSGKLFASTATAFYLSEDGGETWTNVLNMPAWTVTIDPNMPSTVYATTRTQGIFRSPDGGHTWQDINTGITTLTMGRSAPVIIDPTSPETLYVGSEGGGVFKSLDGGDHWLAVSSGLDELTVAGLAMDPSNPAVLYACGPNGVYKTLTGGELPPASSSISVGPTSFPNMPSAHWRQNQIAAVNASIGYATAVTTDAAGNVYFVSLNSVFKVDPEGVLTLVAGNMLTGYSGGGGPAIEAQLATADDLSDDPAFGFPGGLTVDTMGNLYISDAGNKRVRRVSPDGFISTVAGNGVSGYSGDGWPASDAQISNPHGLAADTAGNLYIADGPAVRMVSPAGIITTAAAPGGLGVAFDPAGNLYIVDYSRVREVSPDGSVATVAGGTGFIGDFGDGGPATSAAFIGPSSVVIDGDGNLYIGDVTRVRKVSSDGIIHTVAGGGQNNPGDGGPATSAQISVQGLALDSSGNLYIAGYGRVRKVSPNGIIDTVAGNGDCCGYSGEAGPALGGLRISGKVYSVLYSTGTVDPFCLARDIRAMCSSIKLRRPFQNSTREVWK